MHGVGILLMPVLHGGSIAAYRCVVLSVGSPLHAIISCRFEYGRLQLFMLCTLSNDDQSVCQDALSVDP